MSETAHTTVDEIVESAKLPADDRHRLFGSERRRQALRVLEREGDTMALEELANAIERKEAQRDNVNGDTTIRIASELHHVHLPMLAESGVIEYDPEHRVLALVTNGQFI